MSYITVKEIAEELKVSRSRAYAIAHQCTRLVDGRSIRVSRASFEVWKKLRTCPPCPSSSEVASGGATSALLKAKDVAGPGRPGATTTPQPSLSGVDLSESRYRRPIVPRTRPLSIAPSPSDMTNVRPLADRRER